MEGLKLFIQELLFLTRLKQPSIQKRSHGFEAKQKSLYPLLFLTFCDTWSLILDTLSR